GTRLIRSSGGISQPMTFRVCRKDSRMPGKESTRVPSRSNNSVFSTCSVTGPTVPESTMNRVTTSHEDPLGDPLRYHGDQAAAGAVIDFAVNVQADTPPDWLREVVRSGVDTLGAYPGHELHRDVTAAVAAHHGVAP